ncbi:LysR family transcriptional regulator [Rhizobium phaseoli]|uniref:LysR family transcriptional regulator n=2 Tax=Rhizobium TaxID=379 RepID=UPI001FDF5D06|nr:LysR family transcriptional regulator [Rhizobium phaseoli]
MVSTRADLADLETFVAIARAGGFRKAAALRGVSGSALSHSIRGLEARLGVRLFHRTSRSISLTAAGEVLLAELEPRFLGIQAAMDLLDSFRSGPTGRVRVTTLRDAAELLIAPRLHSFRKSYPDVEVEVSVEDRFIDMVAEGFDAGIRYGGTVPEGMIASRLTSELEWIVVGSPAYLNERGRPARPEDLLTHECIRIRTGTDHLCKWEQGNLSAGRKRSLAARKILGSKIAWHPLTCRKRKKIRDSLRSLSEPRPSMMVENPQVFGCLTRPACTNAVLPRLSSRRPFLISRYLNLCRRAGKAITAGSTNTGSSQTIWIDINRECLHM